MTTLELNHVAIAVSDVPRSVRFYRDALGLLEIPRPAFNFPGAWFRVGSNQELHLIGGHAGPVAAAKRGEGHFALRVPDLATAEQTLRARHAPFDGPMRRPDGARQIFLADPDGNVIELCADLPS
ncbi:MAG TPA: VOC family protein [Opitutaceae bacterium]|jgi:catechol 2,3-dioxygenase-like lactoylglutathione lyase family enzyme